MEQQTRMPDMRFLFLGTRARTVSLSPVECTSEYEDAEDYQDKGPNEGPDAEVVSACLQEQTETNKYD